MPVPPPDKGQLSAHAYKPTQSDATQRISDVGIGCILGGGLAILGALASAPIAVGVLVGAIVVGSIAGAITLVAIPVILGIVGVVLIAASRFAPPDRSSATPSNRPAALPQRSTKTHVKSREAAATSRMCSVPLIAMRKDGMRDMLRYEQLCEVLKYQIATLNNIDMSEIETGHYQHLEHFESSKENRIVFLQEFTIQGQPKTLLVAASWKPRSRTATIRARQVITTQRKL